MRSRHRQPSLQRYRNLPMDTVLALLSERQDEEHFGPARSRREKHSR